MWCHFSSALQCATAFELSRLGSALPPSSPPMENMASKHQALHQEGKAQSHVQKGGLSNQYMRSQKEENGHIVPSLRKHYCFVMITWIRADFHTSIGDQGAQRLHWGWQHYLPSYIFLPGSARQELCSCTSSTYRQHILCSFSPTLHTGRFQPDLTESRCLQINYFPTCFGKRGGMVAETPERWNLRAPSWRKDCSQGSLRSTQN